VKPLELIRVITLCSNFKFLLMLKLTSKDRVVIWFARLFKPSLVCDLGKVAPVTRNELRLLKSVPLLSSL
jgi:hypothetical protein